MSRKFNVNEIEIKSFRGIKNFSYNFDNKSLVLCGPNGCGKSSITQAFEYLFTGQIASLKGIQGLRHDEALVHKGDAKEDLLVRAKIGDKYIQRSFNEEFDPGELSDIYEDFKNGSFLLNRKKLLSFIESKPKERYDQITGLISYEKYDDIETKLRQATKAINDELSILENKNKEKINELTQFYNCEEEDLYNKINISLKKNNLSEIDESTDLKQYTDENKITKPHKLLSQDIEGINRNYLELLDNYENITLMELKTTNFLVSLLEKSKEYLLMENPQECPICQNEIDSKEIIEDLSPKINLINEEMKLFKTWKNDCDNLISKLTDLNYQIKDFNSDKNILDYDLNDLIESLKDLSNFDKKVSEMDKEILDNLSEDILSIKSKIQTNADEINKDLDNLMILKQYLENKEDLEKIQKQYEVSNTSFELFKKIKKEELENILNQIEDYTIEFFNYIHKGDEILNPKMKIKGSSGLLLGLFFGDDESEPRSYSSEGHIDTLGLCLFLAFVKEFNEYDFIILDDIISTVDLEHKEQVISLLFKYFGNYRFIITTHNKLWFEQLFRLAEYYKRGGFQFIEITDWDKYIGPTLSIRIDEKKRIEKYINDNDTFAAGNAIRRHLEYVLDKICKTNGIALPIKKHYTVDDYFQPTKKFTENMFSGTNVEEYYHDVIEQLDLSLYKANLTSHNNELNYDLNMSEIKKLRDAVYNLEIAFKCKNHKGNYVLKFNKDKGLGYCSHKKCRDFFTFKKIKKCK